MSTQQPEALRLAAALDELFGYRSINTDIGKVASELRRLHAMNEQLSWVNQCHEMRLSERSYEIQIDTLKFEGMTLRDYFAIHGPEPTEQQVRDYFLNGQTFDMRLARAELRYLEADAMLQAREV